MNVNDGMHGLPETLGISPVAPISNVKPQAEAGAFASGATSMADRTEVSTAASLAHQAMSASDVRMDKVVAIQQALAAGSYQVSPADVADKLMQHMTGK